MAYEGAQLNIPGLTASGDLSSHQYKFVVMSATGVALNTTAGGLVEGVLQNDPAALGREATVTAVGTTKCKASAAIAKGARVMSTAAGLAATATATNEAVGVALEAATAANDIITVHLYGGGSTV
jgi:hypothetical protein